MSGIMKKKKSVQNLFFFFKWLFDSSMNTKLHSLHLYFFKTPNYNYIFNYIFLLLLFYLIFLIFFVSYFLVHEFQDVFFRLHPFNLNKMYLFIKWSKYVINNTNNNNKIIITLTITQSKGFSLLYSDNKMTSCCLWPHWLFSILYIFSIL